MYKFIRAALVMLAATLLIMSLPFPSSAASAGQAAPSGADMDPDAIVMVVNGHEVNAGTIDPYFLNLLAYFTYYYGWDTTQPDIREAAYQYATEQVLANEYVREKAAQWGIILSAEDMASLRAVYDSEIDEYEQGLIGQMENPTEEEIRGAHEEAVNAFIGQGYTMQLVMDVELGNKVRETALKEMPDITDDDIQSYYESLVEQDRLAYGDDYQSYEMMQMYWYYYSDHEPLYVPEGVRGVKHILLSVPEEWLDAYQDALAAREEAYDETENTDPEDENESDLPGGYAADPESIRAQILAFIEPTVTEIMAKAGNGVAFDELVAEYGEDPGMREEPYKTQGYPLHLDAAGYDKDFKDAAFNKLEQIGDISEPIVSSFGVHILYYAMDVPSGAPAFNEALRDTYQEAALAWMQDSFYMDLIEAWIAASEIEYR